ncbi:MAG: 1-phosphofructokinase family hexose kinase [Marinobacter sp.]|nr:1-phosphofructokinase family hexose kinase [Marinobacter sp.]
MPTIVTLTMNPTVDLFGATDELVRDAKSRCEVLSREPGGGGINVARNLHRLGLPVQAVFPAGGILGKLLQDLLNQDGLAYRCLPTEAETRQNFALSEQSTGRLYHFVFPGPQLQTSEWQACLAAMDTLPAATEYLILSGSLPAGVPEDFYAQVATNARMRGIKVILDTSGAPLRAALKAGVYIAKINHQEFAELGYTFDGEVDSMLEAMVRMVNEGSTEILIVTLGPKGALLVSRDGECLHAWPPPTEVVGHVGAGDGFVSLLVYQLCQGKSLDEAFAYGVAAAAAVVRSPGNQVQDMTEVEALYREIESKRNAVPSPLRGEG